MIRPLQGMRFFFAIFVLLSHYGDGTWGRLYAGGNVGVSYFFMLSGFVLALGYKDRLTGDARKGFSKTGFWRRRCSKIFLPHWLCLIATLLSCPWTLTTLHELWPSALLLQAWFPDPDIALAGNRVSWFLSAMLFLYFLFPFIAPPLLRASPRRSLVITAVTFVAYLPVMFAMPTDAENGGGTFIEMWLYVFPPTRIFEFVFGIELFRLYELLKGRVDISAKRATVAEAVAVLVVLATVPVFYMLEERYNTALLFFVPTALIILVMALTEGRPGAVSRFFTSRAMMWLGGISFEFFLVHLTVLYVIEQFYRKAGISMPYVPGLLILIGLSVIVAVGLKYAVEMTHKGARRIMGGATGR